MGRRKRLSKDAEPVTLYLTPEEQLVLQVIRVRRKKRSEDRSSPSEIVSDGLWRILTLDEKVSQEQIRVLLTVESADAKLEAKIKQFPQKGER